jgi:hypothetical protein
VVAPVEVALVGGGVPGEDEIAVLDVLGWDVGASSNESPGVRSDRIHAGSISRILGRGPDESGHHEPVRRMLAVEWPQVVSETWLATNHGLHGWARIVGLLS